MKMIIDDKLYDSEKMEEVYEYSKKYKDMSAWGRGLYGTWETCAILKTQKGAWVCFCELRKEMEVIGEDEVKRILKEIDPDKYIALFGAVEEG